jgi:hypothetical protein
MPDEFDAVEDDPSVEGDDTRGGSTPAVVIAPTMSSNFARPRFQSMSWTPNGDGTGTAEVVFREGRSARVDNLPESVWASWRRSSSPGRFWANNIEHVHSWSYS